MDNGSSDSSSTSSDAKLFFDDEAKGPQTTYAPDQNSGEKTLENIGSTLEAVSPRILNKPVECAENERVPDSGISSRNSSPSMNTTKTEKKRQANMLAARHSRQKKKDYISKLEASFQSVRSQHEELVNQVVYLKERWQYYWHSFSPVHAVFPGASASGMQTSAYEPVIPHLPFRPGPSIRKTGTRRPAVPNLSKKKPNVAAQKSRQKKRDYVRHLEESFETLCQQHKELAEELINLKGLRYIHQLSL